MSDVIASDQLRLLIERIERLEEEKKGLMDDIKDVYGEAKATGFDVKTIRACVRLRKMEKQHREEAEALLETYKAALGMDYSSTPLGSATVERAVSSKDIVKLAADIHDAGGRIIGDSLVMPMSGQKEPVDRDEHVLYPRAVELVREHDKASTSWLQRQLSIGYNTAARLIERMEREGKVSKPNHVGARTVMQAVADLVNAGALGAGVTATVG